MPIKCNKFELDKTQLDPELLKKQGKTTHRTFPPNHPKLKDAIPFNLSTELSTKTRQIEAARLIEDSKRNTKTKAAQLTRNRVSLMQREVQHEAAIRDRAKHLKIKVPKSISALESVPIDFTGSSLFDHALPRKRLQQRQQQPSIRSRRCRHKSMICSLKMCKQQLKQQCRLIHSMHRAT